MTWLLTLGLGTRPSLPLDTAQQLQKGAVSIGCIKQVSDGDLQVVLYKNTCSILLPKPPSFPVRREALFVMGKVCCHAETLVESVLNIDGETLMGASSCYI